MIMELNQIGTKFKIMFALQGKESLYLLPTLKQGLLAQSVQSTCLTSRGSGVRVPHSPRKRALQNESPARLFWFMGYRNIGTYALFLIFGTRT
jgi:hypothetical protein